VSPADALGEAVVKLAEAVKILAANRPDLVVDKLADEARRLVDEMEPM
jgi:hypothetical protein